MADTNLGNVVLEDANAVVAGRGDYAAQMALIKTDLSALATRVAAAIVDITALVALANDLKAKFNAHTHAADGAQGGAYFTSPPRTDAATVTAGTTGVTAVANAAVTVTAVTVTAK